MSFFDVSTVSTKKPSPSLIPRCGACGLYKDCKSPKMHVTGQGRKGILVIAEAPGEVEDDQNEQLVGPTGQLFRDVLRKFDVDLDRDCWKTNAIICRPEGNRTPTNDEIDHCRPNLLKAIRELKPRMIMPLGGVAVRSLLGPLWREDVGPISQWVGWKIPLQRYNCWITPIFHPSYVKRAEEKGGLREGPAIRVWFERHIESALSLTGMPWDVVPDYKKQVRIVMNPEDVNSWIRKVLQSGGPVSFDYETNCLKPDNEESEIVSCAVCWKGEETIAYPFVGAAISATRDLLVSELPKIGANAKFETRWSRSILGVDVNNWVWDSMLSAHLLDNRRGITSVKFQGFVKLGQEDWSADIKPYLESVNSKGINRIREVDLRSLLTYNGIDAVVEFELAKAQRKEMFGK